MALLALFVYCFVFLAIVIRAVMVAPKKVGIDPGFLLRYSFAFGSVRPDVWWWILVELSYGLSLTVVKVISFNVLSQIFLTMVLSPNSRLRTAVISLEATRSQTKPHQMKI